MENKQQAASSIPDGAPELCERKEKKRKKEKKEGRKRGRKRERKKNFKKNEDSVRIPLDNFKQTNIHIMGVSEEETEPGIGNPFEKIMTENFLNLVKEIDIQVQEVQRISNKKNPKRSTPRHILMKMPKVKIKRES